jgi:hypothetical protein
MDFLGESESFGQITAKTAGFQGGRPCADLNWTFHIDSLSICLSGLDLLDHLFFLLFCARFSRGMKRASGACSPVPRAAFLRGSQETSLFDLFLG